MDKLGKYEVIGEIGRGGMGTVYKGRDPIIDRDVAIKVISGHVLNDPSIRKRFYREAKSAGRLSHPNITVIYDVGEQDEMPYIVMELLQGQSLKEMMQDGKMTLEDEIDVMIQVAQALAYAHQHQVIHRDIKPDNIHVLPSGRVKVLDFGIARIDSEAATMTNSSIGTPKYMSPEQIDGRDIDHRTDIFSFGALFYEMLAGQNPFQSDRLTTTIYRVLNEQPERVRINGAFLRDDVQDVVFRCLAKEKADRYADFGAVIDDLMAVKENVGADGGLVTGGSGSPFEEDATRMVRPSTTKTLGGTMDDDATVVAAPDHPARPKPRPVAVEPEERKRRPGWQMALLLVTLLGVAALAGYFAFTGGDADDLVAEDEVVTAPEDMAMTDAEPIVAVETTLDDLKRSADKQRELMEAQKKEANEAGAQGDGAYEIAARQEEAAETAYDEGDRDGYTRAVSTFVSAEQSYAAAEEAARRRASNTEAERPAAPSRQSPAQSGGSSRPRTAEATPPPATETTPPPASTSPARTEAPAPTPTETPTTTEPEPTRSQPSEPARPTSSGIGVSGGSARTTRADGAARSARSTAQAMRGTVNDAAHDDARFKLAQAAERRAQAAFDAKKYSEATSLFNLAGALYPQVKLSSTMPDLLAQSQRQITAVYQRALQRRDFVALQNLFPKSNSSDQQTWRQFIDKGGDISIYMLTANASADDKKASIDVAIHLDYTDPQGAKRQSKIEQTWRFAAGDSGWYVSEMN